MAHISDEELEEYAMHQSMPGSALAALEEHLLICEFCRSRLDDAERFVASMKDSLRLLEARESRRQDED